MEDKIAIMRSPFEEIKRTDSNGRDYWKSRELCGVMGYSTYQKFLSVVNKAIAVAKDKGMEMDDHFNLKVEMVRLGSGAYRNVENYHLSRMACVIIAMNANPKKDMVMQARDYFNSSVSSKELSVNYLSSNILLYRTGQGDVKVEVVFNSETFWMSQKRMATLFGVDVSTINYHLAQIFNSGELDESATIRKIPILQQEGNRTVERYPLFYNLDAIIAVGYRVNSYQATQFRIWTVAVLKEFIIKGYVMDDERLKQGARFGKDYFDDLLERIREIRSSERRYYQKITDIFAECSIDYDSKSETTQKFFKMVQNMMHCAVTSQTAAEIIYGRANADLPHMGLTTWKKAPKGRIQKSDTIVAKNYLSDTEIDKLNRISVAFLDFAEARAQQQLTTTMELWHVTLIDFLKMYGYEVRQASGKVSAQEAQEKAYEEYEKFRHIQDSHFVSDFDIEMQKYFKP